MNGEGEPSDEAVMAVILAHGMLSGGREVRTAQQREKLVDSAVKMARDLLAQTGEDEPDA